jgi:hypothetical protein
MWNAMECTAMNLIWIGRNRSLELSPRARLVNEEEANALRRKREQLQWRPQNGFLVEDGNEPSRNADAAERAA